MSATPARAAPTRVVSLNLCADQYLVLLAPEKVAGLTPLARDPALSFVAGEAAGLPVVRPAAEAILRRHPDLVLAAEFGASTTLAVLRAAGVPVASVRLAQDFPGIRAETLRLAGLLGVPERGAALVTAMDATLATLPHPTHRLRAIAWEPRGYTDGPHTLMGAVLRAAGLKNMAGGRRLGREALLRNPPDLLVVPQASGFPSLATALLNDPALAGIPHAAVPSALTICAGPFTARAAVLLASPAARR